MLYRGIRWHVVQAGGLGSRNFGALGGGKNDAGVCKNKYLVRQEELEKYACKARDVWLLCFLICWCTPICTPKSESTPVCYRVGGLGRLSLLALFRFDLRILFNVLALLFSPPSS